MGPSWPIILYSKVKNDALLVKYCITYITYLHELYFRTSVEKRLRLAPISLPFQSSHCPLPGLKLGLSMMNSLAAVQDNLEVEEEKDDGSKNDGSDDDKKAKEEKRRISMLHLYMTSQMKQYDESIAAFRTYIASSMNHRLFKIKLQQKLFVSNPAPRFFSKCHLSLDAKNVTTQEDKVGNDATTSTFSAAGSVPKF